MDDIKTWLVPLLEKEGCQLYGLEWEKQSNPPVLRILIDRNDEPVDLDICTKVSEAVSAKLDEVDPSDNEYILEVCSAGVDKPIQTDALESQIGQYVQVDLLEPANGVHHLEGTLTDADAESLTLSYFIKGRPKKTKVQLSDVKQIRHAVKI